MLPLIGPEPFEEWAEGRHAGSNEGEVVFDAAVRLIRKERR